jgi:hypothetical protein
MLQICAQGLLVGHRDMHLLKQPGLAAASATGPPTK